MVIGYSIVLLLLIVISFVAIFRMVANALSAIPAALPTEQQRRSDGGQTYFFGSGDTGASCDGGSGGGGGD